MVRNKQAPTKATALDADQGGLSHGLEHDMPPESPQQQQEEEAEPQGEGFDLEDTVRQVLGPMLQQFAAEALRQQGQEPEEEEQSRDTEISSRLQRNMANLPVLYDQFISNELETNCSTVDWFPKWLHEDSGWGLQAVLHSLEDTEDEPHRLAFQPVRVLATNKADPDPDSGAGPCMVRYDCYMPPPITIPHTAGPIHKLRLIPQAPHLVAVKTNGVGLFLYNVEPAVTYLDNMMNNGKSQEEDSGEEEEPDMSQLLVAKLGTPGSSPAPAGRGLSWSPVQQGSLLSTCDNGAISLIEADIGMLPSRTPHTGVEHVGSTSCFQGGHPQGVNDVAWAPAASLLSPHVFASVGQEGELVCWDRRAGNSHVLRFLVHRGAASSLDFSPVESHTLITGGADCRLNVIDVRCVAPETVGGAPCPPKCHVHTVFAAHHAPILQVSCSPARGGLVASTDADGTVLLWDLHATRESVFSPPQLRMRHVLHAAPVNDLSWSRCSGLPLLATASDEWLADEAAGATEGEEGAGQCPMLQVWSPSQDLM